MLAMATTSNTEGVSGRSGAEYYIGDIAVADISGNGHPDLLVFSFGHSEGANSGYYRIGWDLQPNGDVSGWTEALPLPAWFEAGNHGAGVALAHIGGGPRKDLLVFRADDPLASNYGHYRVGFHIDNTGRVARWSEIKSVPNWFGAQKQGLGIAINGVDGNGSPDLVALLLEDASDQRQRYCRIGYDIDANGDVRGWSEIMPVPPSLKPKTRAGWRVLG